MKALKHKGLCRWEKLWLIGGMTAVFALFLAQAVHL